MRCPQRYLNAKSRAEGELQKHGGRQQILDPSVVMVQCIKASAVAVHATTCPSGLNPEVLCLDNNYKTRKIKEALQIRSNRTINRDNGLEVDEAWNTLVLSLNCCALEQSRNYRKLSVWTFRRRKWIDLINSIHFLPLFTLYLSPIGRSDEKMPY